MQLDGIYESNFSAVKPQVCKKTLELWSISVDFGKSKKCLSDKGRFFEAKPRDFHNPVEKCVRSAGCQPASLCREIRDAVLAQLPRNRLFPQKTAHGRVIESMPRPASRHSKTPAGSRRYGTTGNSTKLA